MEINKGVYEANENVGDFKEIVSSIRAEDLGIALDMVSRNLYSNPIGSFVRELVSNGVDANVDNEISRLVTVNVFKEDGSWYFQVTDEGKGMTPEHFTDVYMKWFNSDKRTTNTKIGGWGLGSKSPLGYVEQYELITIAEGVEYHYLIARQQPAPTATLLSQKETNKPSGTVVKVEVDEKDLWELNEEMTHQLAYFNNVIVKNDRWFYDNNFKIIETDLFKVRDSKHPFGNDMHIVLGQVAYPINWSFLGIERIQCPIAVKFEVGELDVTLSREEINYKDDVKDFIINRINAAYERVLTFYKEGLKTNSFLELIRIWNSDRKQVKIGTFIVPFITNTKITPILLFQDKELTVQKQNLDKIFSVFRKRFLNNTKVSDNSVGISLSEIDDISNSVYYREGDINHWSNLYRNTGYIYSSLKINYNMIKHYALLFNLASEVIVNRKFKVIFKYGGVRTTYYLIKALIKEVKDTAAGSYDHVPQFFIDQTKEAQRLLQEERKGNVTHYTLEGRQLTDPMSELLDRYKIIYYISRDESYEALLAYSSLYKQLPTYYIIQTKFIIVSPSTVTKIKRIGGVKPAKDLFKDRRLRKFFGKLKYRHDYETLGLDVINISRFISSYYYDISCKLRSKLPYTLNHSEYLRNKDTTSNDKSLRISVNIYIYFQKEIHSVAIGDYKLKEYLSIMEAHITPLMLLSLIKDSNGSHQDAIIKSKPILKKYKITKLNPHYYGKSNT